MCDGPITNCIITNNTVSNNGGGIYCCDGPITNCIIAGNSAGDDGGGIDVTGCSNAITNCTITGNTAGGYGGGIYARYESNVTVRNCILWDNVAASGPEICLDYDQYGRPCTLAISCCDVDGGKVSAHVDPTCTLIWGLGNIESDPLFADPTNDDYHLQVNSFCINTGDSSENYSGQTDIDGEPRVFGLYVDMGADEFIGQLPELVDLTITGPDRVEILSERQYHSIAGYDNGNRRYVTNFTNWSIEPDTFASIDDGLLRIGDVDTPQNIIVYAKYIEAGITVETEKDVLCIPNAGLNKIYWTDTETGKIQRANPDGTDVEDIGTGLSPRGIAIDASKGKVYWIDYSAGKIQRANLDGSLVEVLVTSPRGPEGIALDVFGGKMYWTRGFQRADLDGSNVEKLLYGPDGDIALDPAAGKVYWPGVAGGYGRTIERANLDGTGRETLVEWLDWPGGIALDTINGKMYWTATDKIQRANLDGTDIEDLVTTGLKRPDGIALDLPNGKMYWTDLEADKIQRANLDGTDVEDLVTTGLTTPLYIAVPVKSDLPTVTNLEIIGPKEVGDDYTAGYKAIAHCEDGGTIDVTGWVSWAVSPDTYASIDDNGLLYTKDINVPRDITIFAQYAKGGVTIEAEMDVHIYVYAPSTLYVPADYKNIQSAINAARAGCTIVVADGTYTGDGNRDIDFLGKAITVRSQSGPQNCIIDCQGSEAEPHRGFLFHSGEDANSILDGFSITNGCVPTDGGGVYNYDSSPRLINCIFRNNSAEDGGGVFNSYKYSHPTLINCTFCTNSAKDDGGGMFNHKTSPILIDCVFRGNCAHGSGGGIFNWSGSRPKLRNCIFTGNVAYGSGGAIRSYGSDSTLINCVLNGNAAKVSGGGIYCGYSDPRLVNCTFSGNVAKHGGGMYNRESNPRLINCILWGDTPEEIYVDSSTPVITYSAVQGGWRGTGNISQNPLLAPDGYHLSRYSVCINKGTNTPTGGLPETDIDGEPRIIEGRVDIGADEFKDRPLAMVGLEIRGPDEIIENSSAQYTAIASYEHGYTKEVTTSAIWTLEPQAYGNLDAEGLLTIQDVETPQNITIHTQYTEGGITVEAEMVVQVYCLAELKITGPNEVVENYHGQYEVLAYYDNGNTLDVTDSAQWWVEPEVIASIEAGLLQTGDIETPQDVTIYARYTEGGLTLQAAITVYVFLPDIFRVPAEYETIQAAIDAAADYDIVLIPDGTYTGPGNRDIDFRGKAIFVDSENGPENCIIDCEGLGAGFHFHTGEGEDSILSGLTIINGDSAIICENSCSPTITDCIITSNNRAINCSDHAWPTISNCTISKNKDYGINCYWESSPKVTNCTIAGNGYDGVHCLHDASATITNCTIAGNGYNGVNCIHSASATITNCLIWSNPRQQIAKYHSSGVSVSYSNVEGGYEGEGNIHADPCFAFLDDHHIMANSGCVDAGTNSAVSDLAATDIDGNPRVLDGDGDANANVDIGTYEYNPNSPSIAVSPSMVSFSFIQDGPQPDSQSLLVRNCGGGTLNWDIVEDCNWLEVAPANDISTGQINEVTLTVDTADLTPGCHTCFLRLLDPNAVNSPRTVAVELHIFGEEVYVPSQVATIQDAIDHVLEAGTVIVADGTYTGTGNRDIDFKGLAVTVRSENGPENCIIDCQEAGRGFNFHSGEDTNSVLEGFTITNGHVDDIGGGGAIECMESSPTISNCTIIGSSADFGGGLFCDYDSSPVITNCTISGNSAFIGGGILCLGSSLTITNCTFSGNTAENQGGGIHCWHNNSLVITNCTFAENLSPNGNALACDSWKQQYPNNIQVINSIFRDGGNEIWKDEWSTVVITYSDIQGGWPGDGNIDCDPCFVEAGYWDPNGTPDDANDDFWVAGDYHLLPDSPCIDAGDPDFVSEPNETDLDGWPRVIGPRIDMGAYEYWPPVKAELRISPWVIVRHNRQKRILAWIRLPEGVEKDQISNEPILLYPGEIEAVRQYVFEHGRAGRKRTSILAFFKKAELMNAVVDNGEVELEAVGSLKSGRYFYGSDTVRIKARQ